MRPAGVLCGLAREAALLAEAKRNGVVIVAVSGADPARAARLANELAREEVRFLVSFGLAGALNPAWRPGELIVPEEVAAPDGHLFAVSSDPRRAVAGELARAGLVAHGGRLLGVDRIVAGTSAKADLRRRTGADAVDMESHHLAQAATALGRPFVVVRAVADPASRPLPAAALTPLDRAGRPRPAAMAGAILRRPNDIPRLVMLARDARSGLRALGRAVDAAAGLFEGG